MMKVKKRRMEFISFYNHTDLEKHFTKMAKKGWMIEKLSNYYWTYRRIEPKEIRFSVTYYPRASEFDPEPSESEQTFHDFCAHTGWKLAATWHQMQIFYNERENPIPLETDPVLEVKTLHSACKKNFLPSYFLLLAMGLILGFSFPGRVFTDPIGLLSSASNLFTGFCFVCMAVIAAVELGAYYSWYFKAKKAARDGLFVDTPSTSRFQLTILSLVLIGFLLWLINLAFLGDPLYVWVAILVFAYTVALHIIVNCIREGLKKAKASRGTNKVLTFLACFALCFLMSGLVTSLTLFANSAGFLEAKQKEPVVPLSLEDLIPVPKEAYVTQNRTDKTFLISQQVIWQFPHFETPETSGMCDLGYTVTIVNAPLLYNWCKDQLLHKTTRGENGLYIIEYLPVEAEPWEALEAYRQLDEFGAEKNSFLLCYPDRFLLIHLDWDPTEEQMAIVGQKMTS